MKILTIYSILVALSAFWNMTTIVRSAEPVSKEEPVSPSESPEFTIYEEYLISLININEKVLESTDADDHKLIDSRTKNLAKSKEKLEHYRQNIAPLSASITNRYERDLVDSIAMYEWELKNLSHDQVTNEKIRNLITNAIKSTRKILENHRQHLEEKRQEDKLWEKLRKARQEGSRSKIDEAEAALTQFLAERLSKKTEKTYPPDISLLEILNERGRYNQSQGKRQIFANCIHQDCASVWVAPNHSTHLETNYLIIYRRIFVAALLDGLVNASNRQSLNIRRLGRVPSKPSPTIGVISC